MNDIKKKKIFLTTFLFIAAISAFYLYKNADEYFTKNQPVNLSGALNGGSKETENPSRQYIHENLKFSFYYPKNLNIEVINEKEGETIIFQNKDINTKKGFQIFISEFEEEGVLTKERILEDLPDLKIENLQEIVLGDYTPAILFWLNSSEIDRTREVWFKHNGYLYEVTTYDYLDEWLAGILNTWNFNTL